MEESFEDDVREIAKELYDVLRKAQLTDEQRIVVSHAIDLLEVCADQLESNNRIFERIGKMFKDLREGEKLMRKKVVFLSIPMTGKTEMEIDHDFYKAKKAYLNLTGQSIEEVAFVNNYRLSQNALESERVDAEMRGCIFIEPYHLSIWNLGIALTNLAYSDVAFFYGDWENSRGCRIEHAVCEEYDILIREYREDEKETENE